MSFFVASLDVQCSHCHNVNQFERDDKPVKQAARRMVRLMHSLNKDHYEGKVVVNCYTCHQGRLQPVAVPSLAAAVRGDEPGAARPKSPETLLSVDEVLEKCLQAAGGRAALEKITTRLLKGTLEVPGRRAPLERHQKTPNKLLMTARIGERPSYVGYDGASGWEQSPDGSQRDAAGEDLLRTQRDAELYSELRFRQLYPKLAVTGREKIGDRDVVMLDATSRGGDAEKLYFDAPSGLLVRTLQLNESPLGLLPFQTDYEDYKEVDGVRLPFTVRWTRPDVSLAFRYESVEHNVPTDDAKFRKPA